MNRFEFKAVVEKLHSREKELSATKGREYASDQDVLADFRAAAEDLNMPMRYVIYIFMQKHWRAITNYCRTGQELSESLESRILDLNLYSKLLLAEKMESENQQFIENVYDEYGRLMEDDGRDQA